MGICDNVDCIRLHSDVRSHSSSFTENGKFTFHILLWAAWLHWCFVRPHLQQRLMTVCHICIQCFLWKMLLTQGELQWQNTATYKWLNCLFVLYNLSLSGNRIHLQINHHYKNHIHLYAKQKCHHEQVPVQRNTYPAIRRWLMRSTHINSSYMLDEKSSNRSLWGARQNRQ